MGYYSKQIFTDRGLAAIARAGAQISVLTFTSIKTGVGTYSPEEIDGLAGAVMLRQEKQSFPIDSLSAKDKTIELRSIISNEGVTEDYPINEIGLYAREGQGEEFLVSISICADKQAVVPAFKEVPIEMKIADFITVSNTENFKVEYKSTSYVTVEEFRRIVNNLPIVSYDKIEEMAVIESGSVAGTGAVLDSETLTEAVRSVMQDITEVEVKNIFDGGL